MVSRLFKINKPKEELDKEEVHYFSRSDYIELGSYPFFKEYFLSLLPSCCGNILKKFKCCRCCLRSRRQTALKMAREKLDKELNIIEIVKSWRYYEQALRHLLPEKLRLDFKERARYISIDPDPNEEKEKKKEFVKFAKRT